MRDDALRVLAETYDEADALMAAWAGAQGVACPPGCGLCCETFVPDVQPIEAEYLARHLLSRRPAAAALVLSRAQTPAAVGCPFHDPSSAAHCSVYEARPLVCRLFAFAGTRRKNGGWAFRLCRHMAAPARWAGAREVSDASHSHLAQPPMMSDIEARVQGLRSADSGRRGPLPDAVREALERLLLREAYGGCDNEPPQGGSSGAAA